MRGRSVLIIDNDREIVDLLSFYFEEHGFTVDTAVDGHTGVALALQRKPDAIICHTIKDRGIEFAENNLQWHHKSGVKENEMEQLLQALEGQ